MKRGSDSRNTGLRAQRGDAGQRLPIAVYALAMATFAVGTDKDLIVGVLPELGASLHRSTAVVAQLATAFALVYAVAAPIMAVLTAQLPRRRLLGGALAAFATSNFACALAPGYWSMLGARVVAAITAATFTPVAVACAAQLAPRRHIGRALAVVVAGFSVASLVGVPIGSLVAADVGWRWSFALLAAVTAVGVALISGRLGRAETPPPASLRSRLAVLRQPRTLRVLLVAALAQAGGFTFLLLISSFLAWSVGSTQLLPVAITCFGAAGLAGAWLSGRLTDRVGPHATLVLSLSVVTAALLLMPGLGRGAGGALALVTVWALAQWMISVPLQAILIASSPGHGALAASLNSSAMYLGGALAGAVAAGALSLVGPRAVPYAAALLVGLALLCALSVRERADAGELAVSR